MMTDAHTVEERIAELAEKAGLLYRDEPTPGARTVQMPGFIVRFEARLAPQCDGFRQAQFARLVATQFHKPFRLRRDFTLDHPAYGACFEPLTNQQILAEVKRWALATSWRHRHIRRLPLPRSARQNVLTAVEQALQA